jgi:hypothetical protein
LNFRPSGQGKDKSLALPAAITQQIQHKQRTEVQQLSRFAPIQNSKLKIQKISLLF